MTLFGAQWTMTLNDFGIVCVFAGILLTVGAIVILSPLSWMKSFIPVFVIFVALFFVFDSQVLKTIEQEKLCIVTLVFLSLLFGHEWQKYSD